MVPRGPFERRRNRAVCSQPDSGHPLGAAVRYAERESGADAQSVPVVVMSATSGEGSTMTTMEAGATGGIGGASSLSLNGGAGHGPFRWLLHRELDSYPRPIRRYSLLTIVVVTTIVLYYLYYVEGAVAPLMLPYYHMSFFYFLMLLVVSNAVGAFTAFIGGLSDKVGRANLAVGGLLALGIVQLVAVPNTASKMGFAVEYVIIGFIEGIILVVTPALIRDFSPQVGRASAMGFWALGPTAGSLVASLVATRTLSHLAPWQDQFIISGIVCLVMFVIALFSLRELAPSLRDQLMVSIRERALVEARAKDVDVEEAIAHPLRSMLHLDLISSATAISLFLLVYFASVSVLTIYWAVVFSQSTSNADGINTWYWAFDCGALVVVGFLSDRLRVRKPFMLVGALGSIAALLVVISQVHHPQTSYYTLVLTVSYLGVFIGCAYTPWMAAYTEAVEARNPALSATGLAVWGWILRLVVAASFLILPHVVTTATTIVDNQSAATTLEALQAAQRYVPSLVPNAALPPVAPLPVIDRLRAAPEPGTIPARALADLITRLDATHDLATSIQQLPAAQQKQLAGLVSFQPLATKVLQGSKVSNADIAKVSSSSPQLGQLLRAMVTLVPAQKASPQEWERWWWVCLAGMVIFLLLVFTMRGPWSPRKARLAIEEHERWIAVELAKLHGDGALASGTAFEAHRPAEPPGPQAAPEAQAAPGPQAAPEPGNRPPWEVDPAPGWDRSVDPGDLMGRPDGEGQSPAEGPGL